MTISYVHFRLLNPNGFTAEDAYPFEPGMGWSWAVGLTWTEDGQRKYQRWADLDVLLDEWVGRNWNIMTLDVQHYILDFIAPVYEGYYVDEELSGRDRYPQFLRTIEED